MANTTERERVFDSKYTRPFMVLDWVTVSAERQVHHFPQSGVIIDLGQRKNERAKQQEFFLSAEWLQEEVTRVKHEPLSESESPWYHLAGTGFYVKEQVSQLLRNTSEAAAQFAPDVLDLELNKVKVDIESFEDEYLKQMLSLRYNLAWKEVDGKQRIICPDYGNVLWESVTDKKEREGAVYETLFGNGEDEGLEEKLRQSPDGTMSVVVSPAGWSNLTDADGNNIRYPETQLYIIQKGKGGRLQAHTFRYDATIFQNIQLQKSLGLPEVPFTDQKELIKDVLKNVALITPEDAAQAEGEGRRAVRTFEDVIDLMQEAVGGRSVAYEGKGFNEIRTLLKNPDSQRHPLTDSFINRLQDYTRVEFLQDHEKEEREKNLQIAMAVTILQLNRLYRAEDDQEEKSNPSGNRQQEQERFLGDELLRQAQGGMNYHEEKTRLQELPGCAGGGNKTKVTSMGNSRRGEISSGSSEDYAFDHLGTCVACDKGPKLLGPCDICVSCDGEMGGKGAEMVDTQKDTELAE